MTSTRDVHPLGQFDLTTVINLLPGGAVKSTLQDAAAIAQNPITGAVKSIEFWTAFSPPTKYSGQELDAIYRDDTPNPFLQAVQPTIVIDSVLGKRTLAPYGIADQRAYAVNRERLKQLGIALGAGAVFTRVGLVIFGAALGRLRK